MAKPTAVQLVQPIADEFNLIEEPLPSTAAVETIARVTAGAFRKSFGTWPFPEGIAEDRTIAYFVGVYAEPQNGPEAITYRNEVSQVLSQQFDDLNGEVPPEANLDALERITVGVLLTKSLPHPQAAPLAASHYMAKLYLEGLEAT